MYRIYMLCLLLLLVAGVKAQSREYYLPRPTPIDSGNVYLRFNWLGLMDMQDFNVSIGGEKRLNKRWSATMDAGYIFGSLYYGKTNRTTGIILRPGVRLYLVKHTNLYYELQFHYKGVRYNVIDWLDKDLVNNVPAYEEHKTFQVRRRVYGGHILFGGRMLSFRNTRLSMEAYFGLGFRYKEEWLPREEPNSGYMTGPNMLIRQSLFATRKSTQVLPSLPFGFRFVYAIR